MATAQKFTGKGYVKLVDQSTAINHFYKMTVVKGSTDIIYLYGTNRDLSSRKTLLSPKDISDAEEFYIHKVVDSFSPYIYTNDMDLWVYFSQEGRSYVLLAENPEVSIADAALNPIMLSKVNPDHFAVGGGGTVTASDVETADGSNVQVELDNLEATKTSEADVVSVIEGTGSLMANKLVLKDLDGLGSNALAFKNRSFILQDETTAEATTVMTAGQPVFFSKEVGLNAGMWNADGISSDGNNERGVVFNAPLKQAGDYVIFRNIAPAGYDDFRRQRFDVVPVQTTGNNTTFVYNNVFGGGNYGGGTFGVVFYKTTAGAYPWTTYTTASETPQGLGVTTSFAPSQSECQLISKAGYPIDIKIAVESDLKIVMYYVVRQEVIDAGIVTGVAGDRFLAETNGTLEDNYSYLPMISIWEYANNIATNDILFHNVSDVQLFKHQQESYYIVYDLSASDRINLTVIAEGNVTVGSTARVLTVVSSNVEYTFDGTEWKVLELTYDEMSAIRKSKVFVNYPLTTTEEIVEFVNSQVGMVYFKNKAIDQLQHYFPAYKDTQLFVTEVASTLDSMSAGFLNTVVEKVIALPLSIDITTQLKDAFLDLIRDKYYKYVTEVTLLDF